VPGFQFISLDNVVHIIIQRQESTLRYAYMSTAKKEKNYKCKAVNAHV
jgi:hypothetical protein